MTTITDDYMKQMMTTVKSYVIVILKHGPNYITKGAQELIWEHGRRNFRLRADGIMNIVCPVWDETELGGVSIFNAEADEVKAMMDEDPCVKEGIFIYEIHECKSFPGDQLL